MRINVYQIDGEDNARIKFENYKRTLELGGVDPSKYKCVFHGFVNAKTADDVYNIFNGFRDSNIGTYQGHSLSISDVVEIVDDIPEIYGKIDFLYAGKDHIGKVGDTVYYTDAEAFNKEIEESQDCGRPIKAEIIADQHMKLTEPGFYFCDSIGWQKIEFDKAQSAEMDDTFLARPGSYHWIEYGETPPVPEDQKKKKHGFPWYIKNKVFRCKR